MALRVRVCKVSEVVPDQVNAFRVPGVTWPVIVTTLDGALVATPGVCPHEDVSLEHGEIEDGMLVCPGHAYGFDLRTGRCRASAELELRRYKITIVDGDVYVDLL